VAECDIRGFYDSLNHDVVRQAVVDVERRVQGVEGRMDPLVEAYLEQYLTGYDYFGYGVESARKGLADRGELRHEIAGPDPEALMAVKPAGAGGRYGLPQGGALSPLLANLVMDQVDRAVVGTEGDPELLYLRYCDDMIVMHVDKRKCMAALERYRQAVGAIGLVTHGPKGVMRYSKEFHEKMKSKLPYQLAGLPVVQNASPWVNFLGYQIRYDGTIRVRLDSLRRHQDKLAEVVQRLTRRIARPRAELKKENWKIIRQAKGHLVSVGVGKPPLRGTNVAERPRSWAAAFPLLKVNVHTLSQMRRLDKHRDIMLAKLKKCLKRYHPGNVEPLGNESVSVCVRSYCGTLVGRAKVLCCSKRKGRDEGYGKVF
jgi:hypothetical protein